MDCVVDDASSIQSSHNLKSLSSNKKTSSGVSGVTPQSSSTATDPSSQHSHESGFQSAASLSSLEKNQNIARNKKLEKYSSTAENFRAHDSGKYLSSN